MSITEELRKELKRRLRALSLRSTASRLAVLAQLHEHAHPLSHAQLMKLLAPQGWDPATVYRILSDLSEVGLLRRMDLGDHIWRFELIDECRTVSDDHAHFLCTDCGLITCLPELELRTVGNTPLPTALRGAELHLRVTGRCNACVS